MEYYAQIDDDNIVLNVIQGDPTGRFQSNIKWVPCTKGTSIGDVYIAVNGLFKAPELSLADEKRNTLKVVSDIANSFMAYLLADFPSYEIDTWPVQIEEAKALMANPNAEADFLRNLALERRIDLITLAKRVIYQNKVFRILSGRITGRRQYYEDVIKGCTSIERLLVIRQEIQRWKEEGLTL